MNDLGTTSNSTILIVGQIITFLTLVFGIVVTLYREQRNHRWDVEERALVAAAVKTDREALATTVTDTSTALARTVTDTSDALALTVKAASDALALKVHTTTTETLDAIAQNTLLTEETKIEATNAYKEANHVNLKIAAYGKHILAETLDEKKG